MFRDMRAALRLCFGVSVLLFLASSALAQCKSTHYASWDIELKPGEPFQAARVQTFSWLGNPDADLTVVRVYRDSSGRVRMEIYPLGRIPATTDLLRIGSEDFDSASDPRTEIPSGTSPTSIVLDDPCTMEHVVLDVARKQAKVEKIAERNFAPICTSISPEQAQDINDGKASTGTVQLLGVRQLFGVDADGIIVFSYGSHQLQERRGEPYRSDECWCSSKLAIIMGSVTHESTIDINEPNVRIPQYTKTIMRDFLRKEPAAALFRIPREYSRIEVNADGSIRGEAAEHQQSAIPTAKTSPITSPD